MIQNLIALVIFFFAIGYTIFSVIKNVTAKKSSHCGGCDDCSFKKLPKVSNHKSIEVNNLQSREFIYIKHN